MIKSWKSFLCDMPPELEANFEFLQDELNHILGNKPLVEQIFKINPITEKSIYRDAIRVFIAPITAGWNVCNVSRHERILIENLRILSSSLWEKRIILEKIKLYGKEKTNQEIRDILIEENNIFPKNTLLDNMRRWVRNNKDAEVKLPETLPLRYDLSIADQICERIPHSFSFKIKYNKNDFVIFSPTLPSDISLYFTGKLTKPCFFKDKKTGKYKGTMSYEIKVPESEGSHVCGVDIGKVLLYSAVILRKDGTYDYQYIESGTLKYLSQKCDQLYKERDLLRDSIKRCKEARRTYAYETKRQGRRRENLFSIEEKIKKLKKEIAKQIGFEISYLAMKNNCSTIKLEDLSWVESQSGRWNRDEIYTWITENVMSRGILVEFTSARNASKTSPKTEELGKVKNSKRTIQFSDKKEYDRDLIGALNAAVRETKKHKKREIKKLKSTQKKRTRIDKKKQQEIKEQIRSINQQKWGNLTVMSHQRNKKHRKEEECFQSLEDKKCFALNTLNVRDTSETEWNNALTLSTA